MDNLFEKGLENEWSGLIMFFVITIVVVSIIVFINIKLVKKNQR